MADDSTDTLFGIILFILFLALIGYAAGGAMGSSSSTAGTTSGTSQSLPPLSGNEVPSCPLDEFTLENEDAMNAVNLKVYVDTTDAGRKCATASTTSGGTLTVTLAYAAEKSQNVSGTDSCGSPGQLCTASVEVRGTDDYCVSALAEQPATKSKVTIQKVVEPCMMTVPAMPPDRPIPVPADDREDEEGY